MPTVRVSRLTARRYAHITAAILVIAGGVACEYRPGNARAGDSAAAPVVAADSALGRAPGVDTLIEGSDTSGRAPTAVPALDSIPGTAARTPSDTGTVRIFPEQPRRGDVVFALVSASTASDDARCRWGGRAVPCGPTADGLLLAFLPVSADDSAGVYQFVVDDGPGRRLAREVTVAERDFGRDVVFLPRELHTRARSADAARDARALRAVLAGGSTERRWTGAGGGAWREPVRGMSVGRAAGYGADRFYFPAADSARAGRQGAPVPTQRARGAFAADTGALRANETPAWRHAGVDLPVGRGTVVQAPAEGQIADVGDYALTGRTVVVDHGAGVMTAYFHLDSAAVRRGDVVRAGQPLGRVGATGLATGPHLHFGVYVHGRDVDPASWYAMPAWVVGGR